MYNRIVVHNVVYDKIYHSWRFAKITEKECVKESYPALESENMTTPRDHLETLRDRIMSILFTNNKWHTQHCAAILTTAELLILLCRVLN